MPYDPTVEYKLPEPTSADLSEMQSNINILDPHNKGIDMARIAVLYPGVGRGHLQLRFEALVKSGYLYQWTKTNGSNVAIAHWSRK